MLVCSMVNRSSKHVIGAEKSLITCGLIGLSTSTTAPPAITAFKQVATQLIIEYGVSEFWVEQSYCSTLFTHILLKLIKSYPDVKFKVITRYPNSPKLDWDAIKNEYIPPFNDIQNIDPRASMVGTKILRTNKAIIDRTDYLICELSACPFGESISRHLLKIKNIMLLDALSDSII